MRIETIIKNTFENEIEQHLVMVPPFPKNIPVLPSDGKHKKEQFGLKSAGSLIAIIIVSVLISLFSLQTGVFKSSLVVPWADIVKLLPKNPAEAFLDLLQAINSSV
jgi:hypothetical protein